MRGMPIEGMREDPDDPRHGTRNGYDAGKCRCDRCKAAQAEHARNWYAANRKRRRKQQYASYHRRKAPLAAPLNVSPFDRIMFDREERG